MPNLKDIQDSALAKVNSLTTSLKFSKDDFFADLFGDGFGVSVEANPIAMLVTIFKSLKGYDWLIDKIAQFIAKVLPGLEWSVKGVLLANLKAMTTCSINPLITKKIIKNGAVFDINRIDLLNMFAYSPLDSASSQNQKKFDPKRNYYYFGCSKDDGVNYVDDLRNARDFNAVLWYAKNTPNERIVWRRKKDLGTDITMVKRNIGGTVTWYKQPKSNGIVTIEFSKTSASISDSENNPMNIQEPMDNCMHVFIGCNVPLNSDTAEQIRSEISENTRMVYAYDELLEELADIKSMIDEYYNILLDKEIEGDAAFSSQMMQGDSSIIDGVPNYAEEAMRFDGRINGLYKEYENEIATIEKLSKVIRTASPTTTLSAELDGIASYNFPLASANGYTFTIPSDLMESTRKKVILEKMSNLRSLDNLGDGEYPSAQSNYYYMHPLVEFNTDFVLSMDPLFDSKVVTAQLIDALTGVVRYCTDAGGNVKASFQMQFMEAQIRELVEKIIRRDSAVVNDCFFSFTNDAYNSMLQQVEMGRAGLYSFNGINAQSIPSAEEILSDLNTLSSDATKEEIQSAISSTLFKAVSSCNPHDPGNLNAVFGLESSGANENILTTLLEKLVYVIVTIVVSPKVYILMMLNMHIMGQDGNFDLQKYIEQFKDMIIELIQTIKNMILDWFINELNTLISELASQLAVKLVLEQYQYYINLLKKCLMCIKIHRSEYDWAMDDVDYADITALTEYANEEC